MSIETGTVLVPTERRTFLRNDEHKSERDKDEIFADIVDVIDTNGEEARFREQDSESRVE